ncbi:dynein regulatory complex protein 10 [Discoglossus pictus]
MATEILPTPMMQVISPTRSPVGNLGRHNKAGQEKPQPMVDSMKMLEPGRKKLTSVETQRVIAVLDETIKKLELVSLFPYAADNLERFSVIFGSELLGALREHQRLQDSLLRQLTRLNREKTEEVNADEYSPLEEQDLAEAFDVNLAKMRQGIQSSVRNTLRLFLANPPASKTLRSEGHMQASRYHNLIQILSELRGLLFEMLLTSPLEQNERKRFIEDIILRDHKNRETLSSLEAQLNAAFIDRDTEISKKNEIIRQLKVNLHQLEKVSDSQIKRTKQEAEKQQKADSRVSEVKRSKLHQELQQLRSKLSATIADNREIELVLRKKKYKVETEIENWIKKYDSDMGEKQDELEELETVYTEEKTQLAELQEKLAVLEVEYVQIVEERRLAQLKKEEAEKEFANQTQAATLIQAYWRGFQVRRTMKSKKKKKGKGKGKGKGKKGKK